MARFDIEPKLNEKQIFIANSIKMQATFQKHTDNAVSKTINLPENTTIDAIAKLIIEGYDYNLKGFTIYRNKSRNQQVLNTK